MRNNERVAIVTGGSHGIGAGIVAGYRAIGYSVVATSRNITPSTDEHVVNVSGDIRERATAQKIVAAAKERFGRIDTLVGIAVDPTYISPDDPAVSALVRANRRALRTIHDEPDLAARYIRALIPRLNIEQARQHYDRYIAPYFSIDGYFNPGLATQVLSTVAKELGTAKVPDATKIYRTESPRQKSA